MQEKLCLVLIENRYSNLTAAEKKIADVILNNSAEAVDMNVSELARRAGVASSAVIRFCTTLGFEGFSKMKIALAMELARNSFESYSTEVSNADSSADVLKKVFESGKKALDDTLMMLDRTSFDRAVSTMLYAEKICFFGIGTSSSVAQDAGYRIMQLGYPAFSATDPLYMRINAGNLKKGDVAFAISNSGKSRDTIDALRIAHERGATTTVITSYKDSPICRHADIVLSVYSDELRYPIEAVSSRIVTLSVLDAIKVTLSLQNPEKTAESIRMQKESIKLLQGENK
ncbi:MAG: MurR/RpiR family transcriptional regulator [Clostridia bacterium]|nr:MurR/RpiR family transcriptional regulator [Clostridia bacterium]